MRTDLRIAAILALLVMLCTALAWKLTSRPQDDIAVRQQLQTLADTMRVSPAAAADLIGHDVVRTTDSVDDGIDGHLAVQAGPQCLGFSVHLEQGWVLTGSTAGNVIGPVEVLDARYCRTSPASQDGEGD